MSQFSGLSVAPRLGVRGTPYGFFPLLVKTSAKCLSVIGRPVAAAIRRARHALWVFPFADKEVNTLEGAIKLLIMINIAGNPAGVAQMV